MALSLLSLIVSSLLMSIGRSSFLSSDERGEEPRRNYRVEDFLWSGSGDGESGGEATRTVVKTSTVMRTITGSSCPAEDCPIAATPTAEESPPVTSSAPAWPSPSPTTSTYFNEVPDQRYWLVTVLRADTLPPTRRLQLEHRLADLYRTAFRRQQERHLKLNSANWTAMKRGGALRENRDNVSVKVHRVSKGNNDSQILEIIYSVKVAGRAVDALVAAEDMRLVSDKEVTARLGYTVLTKAEPFLKPAETLEIAGRRNTYLLLAASICALLLVIILIILFFLGVRKSDRNKLKSTGYNTREEGTSPSQRKNQDSEAKMAKKCPMPGRSTSEDSLVEPATPPRPLPRPHKPSSPNSYLSMPSVKAFPRGAEMPRPLEQVLEPVTTVNSVLSRHKSETTDPGVVGPIVWDLHCHRTDKRVPEPREGDEEGGENQPSIGRMRRRFQELLEDAFTLFGSQNGTSQDEWTSPARHQPRAKSAITPFEDRKLEKPGRPKTSDTWRTVGGGTVARPLSAGPFHRPSLQPAWVHSDAPLPPTDTAAPLITAIKQELDKFPSRPLP